jgi:tetratricopeptide (TPR) repeat protein
MILDNADDIDVFRRTQEEGSPELNNSNFPLSSYIPQSTTGSVLVTTRDKKATSWLSSGYTSIITVDLMEPEEAEQLLRFNIPEGLSTNSDLAKLVKELDYLPLAISQAAAFISAKAIRMSVSRYLTLYLQNEQSQSRLLDQESGDLRRDPSVPNSVIRTWQISFDQVNRNKPQAIELLCLMAMLDRQAIPEFLLCVQYPDPLDLEDALAPLDEFSLITIEKDGKSFEMHRLVQIATRKWIERYSDSKRWQGGAVEVVSKAFPNGSYSNWKTCGTLSPHALQVLTYVLESSQSLLDRASLLYNLAWYNWIQGRYELAKAESQESLTIREDILPNNDMRIYTSIEMLALVLNEQGKYAEAETMNRQTLELTEAALGKTHPDTLTSMSNLALVLDKQGKYAEAEIMNRQTLELKEAVLGKTHPDTLISMSNLALVLDEQGKYAEAEIMNRQTLELKEAALGKTHPDTLTSMSNLALVLDEQGKYAEAEIMNRQTLELTEAVLGKTHPDTLISMSNLALVLDKQGKYAEAEIMNRQTLELKEAALGKTHPDTLTSVYNLAYLLQNRREYKEASVLYQRACTGYKSVLGPEHPTTKACIYHYSVMLDSLREVN